MRCVADSPRGCNVVSVVFCNGAQVCCDNFQLLVLDGVSACSVLFSLGRLYIGNFLRACSILHLFLMWGVVLSMCLYM